MGIHTAQERARHLETGSYAAPEATAAEIADELASSAQSLVTHVPHLADKQPGGARAAAGAAVGHPKDKSQDQASEADTDRAWHEAALAVCRRRGIRLLAAAVATPERIWRLPDPLPTRVSA